MAVLDNVLQNVATYQMSGLAFLLNRYPMIHNFNKKFKNFDETVANNRGATVTYDLPPKFVTQDGLEVTTFLPAEQRVRSLTADKKKHVAFEFSAEQYIFNAEDYMERFGKGAIVDIGSTVEADIETVAVTNTNKFFDFRGSGDLTYANVARAIAKYRNQGSTNDMVEIYMDDVSTPSIIENGLGQFVTRRNDEIANSWEIGSMNNANFYSSNLLPIQIAGTSAEDKNADTLTFVSINAAGDTITFSGGTDDANAIRENDLIVFSKSTGLRFLTENGQHASASEVSVRATATAASVAGTIIVTVSPALIDLPANPTDANSNINQALTVADTAIVKGDHRAGLLVDGDAGFLAMPRLPDTAPFPSSTNADPDTGASLRMYYGYVFPENRYGTVYDVLYGFDLVPEYSMRLLFPV